MIAVCAMIDGAKGPTFGVASLRSVSAAVSPDERSEESPKAMSIRGAVSNQQPAKRDFPSASHWTQH